MAYYEADKVSELNANLLITPSSSFTLSKSGSASVTATVTQDKTKFTPNDLKNGTDAQYSFSSSSGSGYRAVKESKAEGTITANGLSYGTWSGNLTFTISTSK